MISTRGRYAIRVLIDLAEHRGEAFTPMKEVAKRQEISLPADEGARGLPCGRYPAANGDRPCARSVPL